MASLRRISSAAGLVVGATAAGAGAIIAAERIAVSRLRHRLDPSDAEKFGTLRGDVVIVTTGDGVPLHTEISGPPTGSPTIVFCHGYTLNQDCWHFQRRDLSDWRLVCWDQRDHGRSGRSAAGSASIDQLGGDLAAVLEATCPGDEPVILVGHSMGGMTIMALADQQPHLFGTKVVGAVLVSTCARGLDAGSPWMPGLIRPVLSRALPGVLDGAARGRRALLVEHGRKVSVDLAFLGARLIGFGDGEISAAAVAFLEQMIRNTPIEVVARFCQALMLWDMTRSLDTLGRVPVTVLVGEKDRLIATHLGVELATLIPGAQLVWVPGGGHVLILERPDLVNEAIVDIARQAAPRGTSATRGDLPRSA
jgi:pimeloyl-ACP methyl ester carboxylesterase